MKLKINEKAPKFVLLNQDGEEVSLNDFEGKWLVIYFYPKDNTSGCTIEAVDFSKFLNDFHFLNAEVVGVSPDSVKKHCSFIEKRNLKITLLSDEQKKVLESYGVWGKKKFMGKEYMGVLRTTLLINPQGKIAYIWKKVNVNGHAEAVLEKLKKLQK